MPAAARCSLILAVVRVSSREKLGMGVQVAAEGEQVGRRRGDVAREARGEIVVSHVEPESTRGVGGQGQPAEPPRGAASQDVCGSPTCSRATRRGRMIDP